MRDLSSVTSVHDRRVALVWQKLFANPKLTVDQLAKDVGLSESRLQHLFVQDVGLTIREIKYQLKTARLHVARRQLMETIETIQQIRESAGYCDTSNFTHDFKKLFGSTPSACRRWEK